MLDKYLLWLIFWYNHQYNDKLKHLFGIKLRNVDNPGWALTICVQENELKDKEFQEISLERTENDWIFCKVEKGIFEGRCGTFNLAEVLKVFKFWAEGDQLDLHVKVVHEDIFKQMHLNLLEDNLQWIVNWYDLHCDGDWEHTFGVKIETIDNSEWSIKIGIRETELEDKEFREIQINRSEKDWLFCKIEKGIFQGNCGTFNLIELLQSFRTWAEE